MERTITLKGVLYGVFILCSCRFQSCRFDTLPCYYGRAVPKLGVRQQHMVNVPPRFWNIPSGPSFIASSLLLNKCSVAISSSTR